MAQLLAPYTNSMRLGQGFNSYTQQICLDQAVLEDTAKNRALLDSRLAIPKSSGAIPGKSTPDSSGEIARQRQGSAEEDDETGSEQQDYVDSQRNEAQYGSGPIDADTPKVQPWVKPQIVTYSSRFVERLSDVTDAMNISGSLSIKTATIGGKASGSYVDSDKFKSSDINFHLQVKVTNQLLQPPDYNIFNKISNVQPKQFTEIYGDTFISGWEEGGELNAIISMKVLDKDKLFEIKASLEAELTTPSFSGSIAGKFEKTKSELSKECETTITVNWAGGGSIKSPTDDWNIASLKKAAAAFPDLVAITPQRTYAILTKYTALASFHEQNKNYSPLEYENAGIYTASLLDHYMDYKSMWKQITNASNELEAKRATIELATPGEDIYALADIKTLPAEQVDQRQKLLKHRADEIANDVDGAGGAGDGHSSALVFASSQVQQASQAQSTQSNQLSASGKDKSVQRTVFPATFAGLIAARKACRVEMAKIVNEVDIVASDPSVSTDITRDAYFLHPMVFRQLLPVVRVLSSEDARLKTRDPAAPILLGFDQDREELSTLPPIYKLEKPMREHDERLQAYFTKVAARSDYYRMQGCAGVISNAHSQAEPFNDLLKVDATWRLTKLFVWFNGTTLTGLRTMYSNGDSEAHGARVGPASHVLSLAEDGSEIITEVMVTASLTSSGLKILSRLCVATSLCNILDTSVSQRPDDAVASPDSSSKTGESTSKPSTAVTDGSKETQTIRWSRPDEGQWSVRGFFGLLHAGSIITLGIVWGKDTFVPVPSTRILNPICHHFLGLGPALQKNVKSFQSLRNYRLLTEKFRLGTSVASLSSQVTGRNTSYFNSLDTIDFSWRIKTIGFSSQDKKLIGLKVTYYNGEYVTHGKYTSSTETWAPETQSELIAVKMTAGKSSATAAADDGWIDTVEFVRSTPSESDESGFPAWPLDVTTLRYLGESDDRVSQNIVQVKEQAPKTGGADWSVKGFYGEIGEKGYIVRLGVIWGRG